MDDKYKKIFELSIDLICIADLKTKTFESVNPAFAHTLGYAMEELLDRPYIEYVHPDDVEKTNRVVEEQLLAGKEVLDFQNRYICKNGEIKWLQWRTRPDLKIMKNYAIARDITPLIKRNDLVSRAEKMLTVGNLAAGLAHELNNPLAGIVNSNQVLINRLDPSSGHNSEILNELKIDKESFEKYILKQQVPELSKNIKAMALKASELLSKLFSFIYSDQEDFLPHSLEEIIDSALSRIHSRFSEITVKKDFSHQCPKVLCARNNLIKAFEALLNNAFEAVIPESENPQILISTRCNPETVEVKIEDNGTGIPNHIKERIFEPFFTTKEEGKGLGLGLSTAYFSISSLHKGTILVSSDENRGTSFTVTLPNL